MKKWFALALLVLPVTASGVQAQYPAGGYYYQQPAAYPPQYPQYYYTPQYYYGGGYYYSQPAPRYVPTYVPGQAKMPAQNGPDLWTSRPSGSQPTYAYPTAMPAQPKPTVTAAPDRMPSSNEVVSPTEPGTAKPSVLPLGPPTATTSSASKLEESPTLLPRTGAACIGPGCRDDKKCAFSVFGDFLYWTVHGADVPFAQAFDGVGPLAVPRGPVGVVSPQFRPGFRLGGGVALGEDRWVIGTFTYFRGEQSADIAATGGNVLHNFLVFPNTVNSAPDSFTANANYLIRLYVGDLDYKCAFIHTDSVLVSWRVGTRYAHLDQDLFSTFQLFGATTIDSRIRFDGFGPRIGLDGEYRLPCGIYGYAQGMANFLFGQFRGSYEEQNVFTGLVGSTSIRSSRAVPVLELELGVGWQSSNGRIRASVGYHLGSWFNTMTTTSFASAIGNVNFTTNGNNFRDNIVFDGFVGRVEVRY